MCVCVSVCVATMSHLKVFNPCIEAGGQDRLGFPGGPGIRHNLDNLLQGVTHAVEHGVLVDARRLTVGVSEACLQGQRRTPTLCTHTHMYAHKEV